jgi:hypothetical protein
VAGLAAACLLAGCTFGLSHHRSGARRPGVRPAFRGHAIFFFGGGGEVAVIGGGTSAGGGSRPKIVLPPIPPAGSSLAIQMPLEAYQAVSTQQQEALAQASNLLTQRCMAQRGFDDTSPASEPFTSVTSLEQIETAPAGLTDPAQAATFGFKQPKSPGGPSGPAIIGFVGQFAFSSALKTGRAYTEALYGFTPGGGGGPGRPSCLQLASRLAYGNQVGAPQSDPVPQIAAQAVSFTQSDPHIQALNRAWSACMAVRHYQYATPTEVERHHWPASPDKREIATAVADVACKAQTNYLNTWLAVEAAYQQALIGRNLAALSQLQTSFAPLLRRAEAALTAPTLPGA